MIHPHTHSDYSNYGMLDAINRIPNMIKKFKEIGCTSWCLTDHNTCSGIIDAYKQSKKAGLKFIPGAELYYTSDLTIKQRDLRHITFWAKDNQGLENLYKMTSEAHGDNGKSPDNFYYKSRIDLDLIRKYREGLMVGTACLGGWLRSGEEINEELLKEFIAIFGKDDIFLEVHTYQCDEQYLYNQQLIELSKKYGLKLITATDAHFTNKEDSELRHLFKNTSREQDASENVDDTLYLQTEDEIRANLSYLPRGIVEQAMKNTELLAEKSNVSIEFGGKHYPVFPCDDPIEELKRQCRKGWKDKGISSYPNAKEYADRLNKVEMPIIKAQGYASYFLITSDLYDFGRSKGFPSSPGRGSAVASLMLWLMGVTQLDPLKYDCVFERFAHMERISPPDIDNDISRKHRGEYIKHVQATYGEVYPCRTFSTVGPGKAIGIAGKALGLDPQYCISLSKSLTKYESDDEDEDISSYEKQMWILDYIKDEENKELIELAKKFVGIIFGYGKHASALIVLNEPISKFCSTERQVDSKTGEVHYVAAANFKYLEEIGLMKLDMLGLKTLDVIQDTLDMIPEDITMDNIPMKDALVSEMLCQGKTKGCFQISSPGMTQLVKQIRPKGFRDLIPLVSLYRPGPLGAIVEETNNTMVQTYIKVKNWTELQQWIADGNEELQWPLWKDNGGPLKEDDIIEPFYLHEKLKPILENTYSIILYQEQILEIAKQLCGYSLGEADMLRRIIGKKKVDEMGPALETMIERGVDNGIPRDVMNKVTHQIVEFASYCFNKSHSAGYGKVAWITSYLKAKYPLQFMLSCINNECGNQEKTLPFIEECAKLKIKVLPPSLDKGNLEWVIEDGNLRMGLGYIKGIGKNLTIKQYDDFISVVEANSKSVTEALLKAGALDYLGIDRGLMLENLVALQGTMKREKQCRAKIDENREALRDAERNDDEKLAKKYRRQLKQWQDKLKEVKFEQSISAEEYDPVAGEISVLGMTFMAVPRIKEGTLVKVFTKLDRRDKEMAWLTLKTPKYGEFRCAVFANGWSKIKDDVEQGQTYKFVVNDKGILEEISINGVVVKLNERRF